MRSDAETVLGRYRLGEAIGAGGMGTVLRGYDDVLGREVAVKLLREELAADERSLTRFRQEARIAASLSHPGIASVYDFADEAGRPAIVMELLDGQDLHTILEREGPMEPRRLAGILAQAADALAYAHGLGAVHRDVKPANIFLTRSGAVKITDFGVAYAAGANQLTTTGAL
ncbi:MAG: serine/threonine protein kinase, partial [Actinobacteria bacterium]|nr:serine/threonine protein kinase [Actinomycetota bacterium]